METAFARAEFSFRLKIFKGKKTCVKYFHIKWGCRCFPQKQPSRVDHKWVGYENKSKAPHNDATRIFRWGSKSIPGRILLCDSLFLTFAGAGGLVAENID